MNNYLARIKTKQQVVVDPITMESSFVNGFIENVVIEKEKYKAIVRYVIGEDLEEHNEESEDTSYVFLEKKVIRIVEHVMTRQEIDYLESVMTLNSTTITSRLDELIKKSFITTVVSIGVLNLEASDWELIND